MSANILLYNLIVNKFFRKNVMTYILMERSQSKSSRADSDEYAEITLKSRYYEKINFKIIINLLAANKKRLLPGRLTD